jgi:hypothetical protein
MEFLLYLSPASQEIYQMISRKVRVVENAPICRSQQIFGQYDGNQNTLTFCTQKIKNHGDVKYYINETLLHESVHIAQFCKSFIGYMKPLGIFKASMNLSGRRLEDLNSSVKINGEGVRQLEHEAFWMEDKPSKVKYVLQKYCF